MPSTAELERIGYDLWRAPEVEDLDGWRLRFAHGVTGRANSVWPNDDGTLPLADKICRAEEWYAARTELPARFQVTDAARPRELVAELATRGYRFRGARVSVETAALDDLLVRTGGVRALVSDELDDDWLALWAGSRGFDRIDVARALLRGSPGPTAFARVENVAVGRGVVLGDWLGITSMATAPEAQRRGHARAIVHALARWARSHGATRSLLQVEETNVPARSLYAQVGFVERHVYRYCVAP